MPLSMGIDPSLTGTGISLLDTDLDGKTDIVDSCLIKTSPKDGDIISRYDSIINRIKTILHDYSPKIICVEGLSFGSKGNAFAQLCGLHFLIRFTCRNGLYEVVPPQTLKKFVTGKGNVKKQVMLLETYKKWGESFTDDNLCDAYHKASAETRFLMEDDDLDLKIRLDEKVFPNLNDALQLVVIHHLLCQVSVVTEDEEPTFKVTDPDYPLYEAQLEFDPQWHKNWKDIRDEAAKAHSGKTGNPINDKDRPHMFADQAGEGEGQEETA